ncbi:hypothetical protein GCM10023237_05800 [Streptomyces coeruleoprunus]
MAGECEHDWRTGPVTDLLRRHRQAVCVRCWTLDRLPWEKSQAWPRWTDEDCEAHQDEVERRFGGHFGEIEREMTRLVKE